MKLNVGSGHPKGKYHTKEWMNIDIAATDCIDEEMNVLNMSVLAMPEDWNNKFDEVHCVHMLEHMNRNFRQNVVTEICRVTAPGGVACIEVPNFEQIVALLHQAYQRKNDQSVHIWKTSIYGKQRYEGDAHHWGFDAQHLLELAKTAGFSKARVYGNDSREEMISSHWKQEPILLMKATK